MSGFYDRLSVTALKLLTKFGQSITLTTTTGVGTTTSRSTKGIYTKTIKHVLPEAGYSSSQGVQIGDKEFLLAADAMPLLTDRLDTDDDSLILAVNPQPIKPANTVLAWRVWGRAG